METSEIGIFLNKSWRPQLRLRTLCFPAWVSAAATKGWAWCNHDAELVERNALLRNLKLLVGSGSLDFAKGMHSLDKHVEQVSFQQFVTFREHGQLKGWQPVAKGSISTHFNSRHGKTGKKNTLLIAIFPNKPWRPRHWPDLCFSAWATNPESSTKGWELLQA